MTDIKIFSAWMLMMSILQIETDCFDTAIEFYTNY